MRLSRIHTTRTLITGTTVPLEDEAAHYVGKVLRLRAGESLTLFNASQGEHLAEIVQVDRRSITVRLISVIQCHADPVLPIHVGLGLSRGERFDYAVQKATEAGVATIVPLLMERCEVKLKGERVDNRMAHWNRIAISASEQCGRCTVPAIAEPVVLKEWLSQPRAGLRFVMDHRGHAGLPDVSAPEAVTFLIGPEGGLSEEEILAAQANGFQSLKLGPRVLRTETAPVIAIAVAQHMWGDFRS